MFIRYIKVFFFIKRLRKLGEKISLETYVITYLTT